MERGCPYLYTGSKFRVIWPSVLIIQGGLQQPPPPPLGKYVWEKPSTRVKWPLFDTPTSTHGVFTSFSLSQYCCLHFWKNKVGFMLAQGFLRVKSQAKSQNVTFVSWRNKYGIIEWPLLDAPTSTHCIFTSFMKVEKETCIVHQNIRNIWT